MRFPFFLCSVVLSCILSAQTLSYTYDAAGRVSSATYPSGKIVSLIYDPSGNLLRHLVINPVAGPAPVVTAAGVLNAASFLGGPVAPGELVTLFGTGIGPAKLANYEVRVTGYPFPFYVGIDFACDAADILFL